MEILTENWFFVLVILVCVGVHVLGHGDHGHGSADKHEGDRSQDSEPQ